MMMTMMTMTTTMKMTEMLKKMILDDSNLNCTPPHVAVALQQCGRFSPPLGFQIFVRGRLWPAAHAWEGDGRGNTVSRCHGTNYLLSLVIPERKCSIWPDIK